MTTLCRTCGRLLEDYTRFCDKCGSAQPLPPAPQPQYQYLQPPPPTLAPREPSQPPPVTVAPLKPPRAGMPVSGIVQQEPPRPETAGAAALSRPAVKVGRWTLRPLGSKLNYLGILGAIVAFASLSMPWWNLTASIPIMGLGNSTVIDFPLYLYSTSASIIVNPSTQVVSLGLWFCWATIPLVASAGIFAIVGSIAIGKGNRILLVGGIVGLISVIVFAIGLQTELTALGSGLNLFTMASGAWGALTAYLSYGFWGALVATVTMLVAATRGNVKRTAPPLGIEPVAQVSPAAHAVRPRGAKFLVAYCILLGICAVASIPFISSLLDAFRQLPLSAVGITLPDLTYLWGLLVLSAFLDFVVAFGLLKRMRRVRTITRVLSIAAVVCALIMICLTAVLLAETSLADGPATLLYGALAAGAVLGIAVPLVVFRYLGRPKVKEYFEIVE